MQIHNRPTLRPSTLTRSNPNPPAQASAPGRDGFAPALRHIGREASAGAIFGITCAGVVAVSDSLGLPGLGRAAVATLGAAGGYLRYKESAQNLTQSKPLGAALAATMGVGAALMAGGSGNVLAGAAVGGLLGVIQAPRSYPAA